MKLLLSILVIAGTVGQIFAYTSATCPSQIPEHERADCYPEPGASESNCESRGCLWCETSDSNNAAGYPWCFYDGGSTPSTECTDCSCSNRADCYPEAGSSEGGCLARGCLWCPSQIQGQPWCFYGDGSSTNTPSTGTGGGGECSSCTCSNKVDCYPEAGSSESGCLARGCLWCPANNGDPWCIYSDGTTLPPSSSGCESTIPESQRIDCWPGGGSTESGCEAAGCLWCESSTNGVPWCFFNTTDLPPGIPDDQRINCIPEGGFSPSECDSRGCLYASVESSSAPMCYFPDTYGYRMIGEPISTLTGYEITLERVSSGSLYGNDANFLTLTVDFDTENRIHWKFTDKFSTRFEVPLEINGANEVKAHNTLYDIVFVNDTTFSFQIIRKSSGAVLWDTSLGGLTFSDQFLQVATYVPDDITVYGFGETEHDELKHSFDWSAWGMYARDQPPAGVGNLYGVHPFYVGIEADSSSHGVLFLNAAAQDITFTPAPGLLYRTIGGVLDFYMFLGPEPNSVIEQYNQAIGTPFLPPYWSLGFQLCRYGYGSLEKVRETVARMDEYGIPLDVQYGDIDYMDEQRDFTIDPDNYVGLEEYVDQLHASGKHYVIILDPCLTADDPVGSYMPYDRGLVAEAYVKNSDGVTDALGKVWPPGNSVFPDYSKPSAQTWWENECTLFHDRLNFDGIWIDMNEPANFVTGSVSGCDNNNLNYPPYHPLIWGDVLADKTLCPDMLHHAGTHYDTHSLYGYFESITTYNAAYQSTGKRPFVISRSTFPGSGKYAAHWLGDNSSQWSHLKNSIIGMLEFNLFGIPYVGADICGFNGNVNEELCARWMELGSFYPYARNHNGLGYSEQDPANFGDAFAGNAKNTLMIRYTMLPYLYTLFYHAHTQGSGVVRPLSFEFASDVTTHTIDEQFLWGGGVMISPVLYEGMDDVTAYFPDARWYEYREGIEVTTRKDFKTLSAPFGRIPIHIRGGYIIPTQKPAVNTETSRHNPFGLIIALDDNGMASGSFFWDGLDVKGSIELDDYVFLNFTVQDQQLQTSRVSGAFSTTGMSFGSFRIFGEMVTPSTVTVNGQTQTFSYHNNVLEVASVNGYPEFSDTLDISWS